ncbi:MAG TPA: carbamoyltransferase C-terminal domain-containing protein [Candidatus Sulfotelmatobacter sp.]|nr:carbamoyltransferase C-terminal domain-containing protein [Candidatus Sulfotelmatobacter sp.]
MYILGLSALSHDSTAALLGPQAIVAAIEEGKLARTRSFAGVPHTAIRFCMERAGISWKDVEQVAVAMQPGRAWVRESLDRIKRAPRAPVSSVYHWNKAFNALGHKLSDFRVLRRMAGGASSRVMGLDHQLCHAASAFYASPFDQALIATLDEQGDGRTGLVALGQGQSIREIKSVSYPHSLARVFTQVTKLLGFRPHSEEHKTQWLSLAGQPVFSDVFVAMLRRSPGGEPHLNGKFFRNDFAGDLDFGAEFYRRLGILESHEPHLDVKTRANIAASLQKACSSVVSEWLESLRRQTGASSLCLAGGLFLNALLVTAVESQTGFQNIFVQPAAGNEGTSLGAAWLAWHQTPGRPRLAPMSNQFWGPAYSNDEIKQVLDNCKANYAWCDSEDRKIHEAVKLLQAGKIVAWFQGAAEFGPRALGNRSLLASPTAPYVNENLNDYVKHRESFRPFALAIPKEDCDAYFECSANARFMTTMARAKSKARELFHSSASGFITPEGLVRLQVVASEDNPLFWKLLKRMGEKAAAPILVNTSFNLFGEPLVITPRDAVRSFYCSGTDALVAGNFLLAKR